jgi:hypothetical protein
MPRREYSASWFDPRAGTVCSQRAACSRPEVQFAARVPTPLPATAEQVILRACRQEPGQTKTAGDVQTRCPRRTGGKRERHGMRDSRSKIVMLQNAVAAAQRRFQAAESRGIRAVERVNSVKAEARQAKATFKRHKKLARAAKKQARQEDQRVADAGYLLARAQRRLAKALRRMAPGKTTRKMKPVQTVSLRRAMAPPAQPASTPPRVAAPVSQARPKPATQPGTSPGRASL